MKQFLFDDLEKEVHLQPEPEEGNVEYKLHLVDINGHRLEKFKSQLKWRVNEGSGKATYYFGIEDQGLPLGISKKNLTKSINNFEKICKKLKMVPELNYIKIGILPKCYCAKLNVIKLEVSESGSIF
jgi:GTPase